MLFEKNATTDFKLSFELVGYTLFLIITTAYLTYGVCVISGILVGSVDKKNFSMLDLINGFAQIATACAFLLALWQFKKVNEQHRQTELFNEAKNQIAKMSDVIKGVKIGDDTNLENLNASMTLLCNLETNFNVVFEAMIEDIQKAIVRMYWQDMYMNSLRFVLINLDIKPIVRSLNVIDASELDYIFNMAHKLSDVEDVSPAFKKFIYIRFVVEDEKVKSVLGLQGKFDSLDLFVYFFLNNSNLNNHMYGLMNVIDIRVIAPLLALAGPAEWALKKNN